MSKILLMVLVIVAITIEPSFSKNKKYDTVIAIDIGHSKKKQGATSSRGVGEYKFNKKMASVLLKELYKKGFHKSFIIKSKSQLSLYKRTRIAKNKKADLFISIHHDSVQKKYLSFWRFNKRKNHYSNKFKGYSIFISNKNKKKNKSFLLAKHIGGSLQANNFKKTLHHAEKIKGENRTLLDKATGVYEFNDLIVLKTATMPAILLECGIIVNQYEEKLLSSEKYQKKFATAVSNGISNYLSE